MTKFTIMAMDDAKEVGELFETSETALINFGAEMYRKGMIKGALILGGGMVIGMITKPIADKAEQWLNPILPALPAAAPPPVCGIPSKRPSPR